MSDDIRFDGKNIYAAGVAGAAIYDIRGNRIHEAGIASQPKYEIRGNHIRLYKISHQRKAAAPGWIRKIALDDAQSAIFEDWRKAGELCEEKW